MRSTGAGAQPPRSRSATRSACCDHVQTAGNGRDRLADVSLTLQGRRDHGDRGRFGQRPGRAGRAALRHAPRHARHGAADGAGRCRPRPRALVQRGVARIPEDRHAVGVVGDLPVWENAVSERLRSAAFSRWPWVRRAAARAHARRIEKAFDVRGAGLRIAGARALGRQHAEADPRPRAAGARCAEEPRQAARLIVAHQPTWGLDVGAVAYVQQQLIAARDAGAAVLLISDDLDEVLALGDRVAVMHGGQLGEPRPACGWTREAIGLAMAGERAPGRPSSCAPGSEHAVPSVRTEARTAADSRRLVLAPVGAVAFTLLVSALLVLWAGAPVGRTYALLLQGGFGSVFAWSETLTRAIPLILTGPGGHGGLQGAPLQHRRRGPALCRRARRGRRRRNARRHRLRPADLAAVPADDGGRRGRRRAAAARPGADEDAGSASTRS